MLIIIFCHVLSMFDNEMTEVMKAGPMFIIVHHGQEFVGHMEPVSLPSHTFPGQFKLQSIFGSVVSSRYSSFFHQVRLQNANICPFKEVSIKFMSFLCSQSTYFCSESVVLHAEYVSNVRLSHFSSRTTLI